MRSPAPSQRLQVTGGILKFTIYQDTVMRLETRRDGKLNLHTQVSTQPYGHPGPVFIKQLQVSVKRFLLQECSGLTND